MVLISCRSLALEAGNLFCQGVHTIHGERLPVDEVELEDVQISDQKTRRVFVALCGRSNWDWAPSFRNMC